MKLEKALKILKSKGITPKAIAKFMKVKFNRKNMLNCIVAFDEKYIYLINENFMKIGNKHIIIERKDETYEISFNDNIVGKLFVEFKFVIYVNKHQLILEDPIEGNVEKFFEEFALKGVSVKNITKMKYFIKKGIKYATIAGAVIGSAGLAGLAWDMFLQDKFENWLENIVSEAISKKSDDIADAVVEDLKNRILG